MKELADRPEIEELVNRFYENVRADGTIGPIFDKAIGDRWHEHLPKMYDFWESLLLGAGKYRGAPLLAHIPLGLERIHFETWLGLFFETLDQHFTGGKADLAKQHALRIARVFQFNLGIA